MGKKKILILAGTGFSILATIGIVFGLKYLGGTNPKASVSENPPQNIRLSEVAPTEASITWTTEEPDYGFVSYGETMSLGRTVQTEERSTVHSIALSHLSPGTTYYYKVGVGGEIYDNEGIPYSFTTPKSGISESPTEEEPTPKPTSKSTDKTRLEENLKKAIGTDAPEYDLNGDGVVNAIDLMILRKRGQ